MVIESQISHLHVKGFLVDVLAEHEDFSPMNSLLKFSFHTSLIHLTKCIFGIPIFNLYLSDKSIWHMILSSTRFKKIEVNYIKMKILNYRLQKIRATGLNKIEVELFSF